MRKTYYRVEENLLQSMRKTYYRETKKNGDKPLQKQVFTKMGENHQALQATQACIGARVRLPL